MKRHSFIVTFMNVMTSETEKQEFASYSDYLGAFDECLIYAKAELLSAFNKYYVIKSIEYEA